MVCALVTSLIKQISLGNVPNAICGLVGGGIGGALLGMIGIAAGPSGALTVPAFIGSVLSGIVGGAVVLAVVGFDLSLSRKAT